jgi:CarD family transcriptional regulator
MFKVGDKVFYPFHGAGKIDGINEKEVLGIKNTYYEIYFPLTGTKISVPADNVEKVGLRYISDEDEIKKSLKYLSAKEIYIETNWKNRYTRYQNLLKSGSLSEMMEVLKSLYYQNRKKEISVTEKRLYQQTLNQIVSEISMALDKKVEEVKEEILNLLDSIFEEE